MIAVIFICQIPSGSSWREFIKSSLLLRMLSKHVDISRQATHKFIKSLEAKGLVEINNVENNKKDKCIRLTKLGEECYEKNESLKANLEKEIANKIGPEQLKLLKDFLKLDWGL